MSFRVRPFLFQLHLYVAIAVAIYVTIQGVTGAIMAFTPEIRRLAHSDMEYVTPAPPLMSVDDVVAAVEKARPGQHVTWYEMDEEPDEAAIVGVGEGANGTVLPINPYTGQILGKMDDNRVQKFFGAVTNIHQRLTPPGAFKPHAQLFMSWVAVAALFLTVSGIYLWFPRMRFGIAGPGRPFWYDLHATLGIAAAIFIFLLTASGVIMAFRPTLQPMIYALTKSRPLAEPKASPPPTDGTQPISLGRAFAIGAEALSGTPALEVDTRPGLYEVWGRMPGARLGSTAFVDQYTGAVVAVQLARDTPGGARLLALNRSIHGADVFGMPSKIILALASLILVVQVVSGAVMWLKRTPLRQTAPALLLAAAVAGIAIYAVVAPAS